MSKEKTYPREEDIKEHKDRLFTAMIQYFSGYTTLDLVSAAFSALFGDAALWVKNNMIDNKLDMDFIKRVISEVKVR